MAVNAERRGWVVDRTNGGHHRLRHPTGATVIVASTPSCPRAVRNAAAGLRRAERSNLSPTAGQWLAQQRTET